MRGFHRLLEGKFSYYLIARALLRYTHENDLVVSNFIGRGEIFLSVEFKGTDAIESLLLKRR